MPRIKDIATTVTTLVGTEFMPVDPTAGNLTKITASNARKFFGPYLSVKDFGATGDGTTDDAAAIQACIDAAISAGAYASVARTGLATVFFPPGTYRVNIPLRVRSVLDFSVRGSGNASKIRAGAAAMECLLDLNGVAYCDFHDLAFEGSGGNSAVRAVWLRWNGTLRSTAWNYFENLMVRDLLYTRAAFELGDISNLGVQVDTDTWVNCGAFGGRTAGGGDVTNYQAGFHVGDGTSANNLLHHFYGCTSYHNRYGVNNASSQVGWFGGMLQANDVDVLHAGRGYTTVKGVRSEGSLRMLETSGPASYPMSLSFEDIDWHCEQLHADQYFVLLKAGGTLRLANVHIPYVASKNPAVSVNSPVDMTVVVDGVSAPTPWTWPFVDDTGGTGKAKVAVTGYAQVDSSGNITTVQWPGALNGLRLRVVGATPADNTLEAKSSADTTVAALYTSDASSFFTLGSADTGDAQNRVRGNSAGYYLDRQDGTQEWLVYRTGAGAGGLYVRDIVNARMHVTYWPGASNTAAQTEFASDVRVLGPLYISGTSVSVRSGAGSPENVVTAPVGSLYTRTDGGAGTTLYVKESGAAATGWIAK